MKGALIALSVAFLACGGSKQSVDPPGPREEPIEAPDAGPGKDDGPDEAEQIAAIQYAVNQSISAVYRCGAIGRADDFKLNGELTLSVELGQGGSVSKVQVDADTLGDALEAIPGYPARFRAMDFPEDWQLSQMELFGG